MKKITDGDLLIMMTERLDYDLFSWGQCAHYAIREGYLVENDGVSVDVESIAEKNNGPLPDYMWMYYI